MTSPSAHSDNNREQTNRNPRPNSVRRNIGLTAIFLIVSAVVFCMIVVRQRDVRSKDASLQWAKRVEASLQRILDERKFLPQKLPDGLEIEHGSAQVSYPNPAQVSRLELSEQPFLVIAGPRKGLIMPGQDGCAGVIFDGGNVEAIWLSVAELEASRERREKLMAGPTESD